MNTITLPARECWTNYSSANSFIDEYLEWKASYTKAAGDKYGLWVRRFHEYLARSPQSMTLADVTGFLASIKGRYSEKTVWYAMTIIRNYIQFLSAQGRVRMPLGLLRIPRAIGNPHYAVSENEYRLMIERMEPGTPRALRDKLIVQLLHDTGMRIGELRALDVDDVHEDMSATVRTEKSTQFRRVFWNPDTDALLQNYLVEWARNHTESDALFPKRGQRGEGRLTARSMQRIVSEAAKAVGIGNRVSPHSFRHAFIHRLAKLGVPDAIIAVLVGHSTPLTISHYTKLSRTEYEDAFRQGLQGVCTPFKSLLRAA